MTPCLLPTAIYYMHVQSCRSRLPCLLQRRPIPHQQQPIRGVAGVEETMAALASSDVDVSGVAVKLDLSGSLIKAGEGMFAQSYKRTFELRGASKIHYHDVSQTHTCVCVRACLVERASEARACHDSQHVLCLVVHPPCVHVSLSSSPSRRPTTPRRA